jgi:hypothetical protein
MSFDFEKERWVPLPKRAKTVSFGERKEDTDGVPEYTSAVQLRLKPILVSYRRLKLG